MRNGGKEGGDRVGVEQVGLAEDPVGQQEGAVGQAVPLAIGARIVRDDLMKRSRWMTSP